MMEEAEPANEAESDTVTDAAALEADPAGSEQPMSAADADPLDAPPADPIMDEAPSLSARCVAGKNRLYPEK